MDQIDELVMRARNRPGELKKERERGTKIIGYTGRFVPEELIYAAGAKPYLICRGGEPEPAEEVLPYMLRILNPYARAQAGYHLLDLEPVYPLFDLIIAECSDCHLVRLADLFEYFKLPTARLGVPADWTKKISFEYYYEGLVEISEKLEALTGIKITNERLREAVDSLNRIRKGLWQISELRRKQPPPIGGYDFIRLNHSSFYCEPEYQIRQLGSIYEQLVQKGSPFTQNAPRILLAGRLVAVGDYVLSKLVETLGAVVVTEFLDEGHRHSNFEVDVEGDLLRNLAETYYLKRTPPSVFQPVWKMRVDSLKNQILEYDIDGVIWYQLSFEEIYDMECSIVRRELEAMEVPFLKLESSFEYSREAMGPLTTRVESFIESIKLKRGS